MMLSYALPKRSTSDHIARPITRQKQVAIHEHHFDASSPLGFLVLCKFLLGIVPVVVHQRITTWRGRKRDENTRQCNTMTPSPTETRNASMFTNHQKTPDSASLLWFPYVPSLESYGVRNQNPPVSVTKYVHHYEDAIYVRETNARNLLRPTRPMLS